MFLLIQKFPSTQGSKNSLLMETNENLKNELYLLIHVVLN